MKIIALTGIAGSGKDEVAQIMTSQLMSRDPEVKIRSLSFAAPIKEAVASILGCDVSDFENRNFKEGCLLAKYGLPTSPRVMMQMLGTEFGRNMIDQDIWLKMAQVRHDEALEAKADYLFITDCRFENEASWVRANEGTIITIERPSVAPVAAHSSEAGISLPCYVIDNSGSIDDLRVEVATMTRILQPSTTPTAAPSCLDDITPMEWDRVARTSRYGS